MNLSIKEDYQEDEVEGRSSVNSSSSRLNKSTPQISIISDGSLLRTPPPSLQISPGSIETNERLTDSSSPLAGPAENGQGGYRRGLEEVSTNSSIAASAPSPLPILQSLSTTWTKRGNKESVEFHKAISPSKFLEKDGGSGDQDGQAALAVVPHHNPWERILQCFQVFKPKKVSASDDEDVSSKKHLGAGLKESSNPGLKKIMTEGDLFLYELAEKSEILKDDEAVQIGKILPPRAIGYPWDLRFTTSIDGFSLHSLYRKMDGIESPVLLILETVDEGGVLGAILSTAPRVAESFYGGSDTALLKLRPLPFCHYPWSGANFYFIQGHDDFLSIGSDGGKFGLWLDDNLYNGRTEACGTFGSPPLLPEGDFKVRTLEVFTLASLA